MRWIRSPAFDLGFILGPPILSAALVGALPGVFAGPQVITGWLWALLIVGVDVAHVYATLFRTYFDPAEWEKRPSLLVFVPLAGWVLGMVLHTQSAGVFWRALAYLAVFHFVRQQYGFLRIYSRAEATLPHARFRGAIDAAMIYSATLAPILIWHARPAREFNWFVEGDFIQAFSGSAALEIGTKIAYGMIAALYIAKEAQSLARGSPFNWPKNLVIAGTAASWWIGIVHFNGDLAFTFTNVLAHGIPYTALVWADGRKRAERSPQETLWPGIPRSSWFSPRMFPVYLGTLVLLAFLEEGLWDGLLWRNHPGIFRTFSFLPKLEDPETLSWLVPLLALPQVTHYILDGFLWRLKSEVNP